MVDISPVLVMAAPSDPLCQQLQHQRNTHNNNTNPNANPNPNTGPWGTWEELLLGSAVLKHGADNWALVSKELQSRARASFSFTPEACRAGYQAIQLRFGADAGREGGVTQWYEELRRLRVAHLKRELEQYDSSIGSLESKIKRLQSESEEVAKAQSSNMEPGGSDCNEVPREPIFKGATGVSVACGSKKSCSNMAMTSEEAQAGGLQGVCHATILNTAPISMRDISPQTLVPATFTGVGRIKQSNGTEKRMYDEASGSLPQHHKGDKEPVAHVNGSFHTNQEDQPLSSSSTLYLSLSKSDTTSKAQEKSSRDLLSSVNAEQEVGGIESGSMETPSMRRHDAPDGDRAGTGTTLKKNNCALIFDRLGDERGDPAEVGLPMLPLQLHESGRVGDKLQGDVSAVKPGLPSLKSVNIEECKNLAKSSYADDDDAGGRKSDESQSLCSPRLKLPHVKRRRSGDGSGPGFSSETQDDVDDKRYVRKALGEKSFAEAMCSLPVESADSTKGKGGRASTIKASSPDALAARVKKEMVSCKDEDETLPGSHNAGDDKDHSRKHVVAPMNVEKKTKSTSSTENSLHREVWGESAEVVNKDTKPTGKRRRLMGRLDRKRKAIDSDDARGATNITPHMSSMKTESLTSSHEASESMQSPGGKEEPVDTEAWHQAERLSGDSRYEKSEVGSYVDGNEDISPMSRRNRREPKVSGKLIPLLESLRTICAHRCGHFFRHNQEPEENEMYYRIVRAPIDLGMIRSKLDEGQYSGSIHFFRDLLLMVSNALVYYPRDSAESAAASGLRECVIKEMGHVFETEALVKQEGPSFRKRDSKQIPGQGRRKGGLKFLSSMDRTSRERDRTLKQSDVSTSIESRRMNHQSFASRLGEGIRVDKCLDVKRSASTGVDAHKHAEGSDCKRLTNNQTAPEVSSSFKSGLVPLERANEKKESPRHGATPGKVREIKEPSSSKSPMHTSRDAKLKDRSPENVSEKAAGFVNAGSALKTPYKGKESGSIKVKPAPNAVQEPVQKRGVGRPPKHSQQQGLLKAREVLDVNNSTRKRSRR